jgi:ATP-dependent protease ClpP protease subunit
MPDRLVTSLTNFRLTNFWRAILCATIGFVQIMAQISLAHAASITTAVSEAGQTIVLLEGEIELSDSTKLALIVTGLDNQGRAVSALYLNSPGGNGTADREMASLVKRFRISTIVADGTECTSACFTVFAAGHRKFAGHHAQIGVHRTSHKGKESAAAIASTVELAVFIRELGVPPAIVGKLVQTPPDQMAWLTPDDLKSMNVEVTGMLRWPGPLDTAARPDTAPARSRASSASKPMGRLTPFKPDGLSWSEYVAETSELSRTTLGPGYLPEDCKLYTMRCSRSFVFVDADLALTEVTTVEDLDGKVVQREVCKSDRSSGVRTCFDWDTGETYDTAHGWFGWERRKRVGGSN